MGLSGLSWLSLTKTRPCDNAVSPAGPFPALARVQRSRNSPFFWACRPGPESALQGDALWQGRHRQKGQSWDLPPSQTGGAGRGWAVALDPGRVLVVLINFQSVQKALKKQLVCGHTDVQPSLKCDKETKLQCLCSDWELTLGHAGSCAGW